MKRIFNFPLLLILIIFLCLSTSLLLDEPMIWPDEAIYGDISRNILLEGRLGTDLWKGFVEGTENHYYSLPPFSLYANAVWFKIFGFSIYTQRLFSVFLASIFLIIFYVLAQKLISTKKKLYNELLPLGATLLLTVDSAFLKASRLSRPEIMVLLLVATAMLLYLRSFEQKSQKSQDKLLFFTGLILGIATITHFIAIGFAIGFALSYIYIQRENILNIKLYYFLAGGFLTPIIVWLISIFPNYQYLIDQLNLVSSSRNHTIPWYETVMGFSTLSKLNYLFYILTSAFFIVFTFKNRKNSYILLSSLLITSWGFATLGELYWYTVYAVPFTYLAFFILISHAVGWRTKNVVSSAARTILVALSIFIFFSNLFNYFTLFNIYKDTNAYEEFSKQIIENIPAGKTVYLSSIPDAYYAFGKDRNTLLEFPALFTDMTKFKEFVSKADYMVFNGIFIPNSQASEYLDKYLAKNGESVKEFSTPYHLLIFKIKDKQFREDVN